MDDYSFGIRSCKDCKNRHVGCHSECEEYKKDRQRYEREKDKYIKYTISKRNVICKSDFDSMVTKRGKRYVAKRVPY